jgi:hypothetical protein
MRCVLLLYDRLIWHTKQQQQHQHQRQQRQAAGGGVVRWVCLLAIGNCNWQQMAMVIYDLLALAFFLSYYRQPATATGNRQKQQQRTTNNEPTGHWATATAATAHRARAPQLASGIPHPALNFQHISSTRKI